MPPPTVVPTFPPAPPPPMVPPSSVKKPNLGTVGFKNVAILDMGRQVSNINNGKTHLWNSGLKTVCRSWECGTPENSRPFAKFMGWAFLFPTARSHRSVGFVSRTNLSSSGSPRRNLRLEILRLPVGPMVTAAVPQRAWKATMLLASSPWSKTRLSSPPRTTSRCDEESPGLHPCHFLCVKHQPSA